MIGSDSLTGYQITDIFDDHRHEDRILYELEKQVKENELYKLGAFKAQEDGYDDKEKEERKEKKLKFIDVDLKSKLKELGYGSESWKKIVEAELDTPDMFFKA